MERTGKVVGQLFNQRSTEERVMIAMTEIETYPLVQAVYEACVKQVPTHRYNFYRKIKSFLLKYGSDQQIEWIPEIEAYGMEWADVYIDCAALII